MGTGKVIKVTMENVVEAARAAAKVILEGGVVAYPTDTLYGLGVDPFLKERVEKLIQVKKRPVEKGIPLLVGSISDAERLVHFTHEARLLAKKFWPGPLTIVLLQREPLPDELSGGRGSIGVRLPDHPLPQQIAKMTGGAVTGTSANISGHEPAKTAREVIEQLGDSVNLILDGGETKGTPSTVIDMIQNPPVIVREGAIPREKIFKLLETGRREKMAGEPPRC